MTYLIHNISEQRTHITNYFLRTPLFVFLIFAFWFSAPTTVGAEYIDSFKASIEVSKDSSFVVTENISYVFTEPRHGLFRLIPTLHHDQPKSLARERYIDITISDVRMDGASVPYEISKNRGELSVKIGDPNTTMMGTHLYTLTYKIEGALSYQENGGAELYWNVTGNGWKVPIKNAEVLVTSKDGVFLRERACYQGKEGETLSCEMRIGEDGSVVFNARNLAVGGGLTVAQAVNRSVVAVDVRERMSMFWIFVLMFGIGIPLGAFFFYNYMTAYKTDKPIIPQYEPYSSTKPMYAGYLFDKRLDPRDIAAGIVYLAEQGFIKIRKTEKKVLFFFEVDDYEITATRDSQEIHGTFEGELLSLLYDTAHPAVGTVVSLSDLARDHQKTSENNHRVQKLKAKLRDDLRAQEFISGTFFPRRTRKGYEALDHLRGFKDFLSVTESQRYIFHNAPAINAEHFMEYLPYAIAFGVEKEWAKTFEKITIPTPDWYDGGDIHTFNAVSLTQSLGAFSTALAATSAPGNASSGGGRSGGGSGGGGGGSW